MFSLCPASATRRFPVCPSHRMALAADTVRMRLPSGELRTMLSGSGCPRSTATGWPVWPSQRRTAGSLATVRMRRLSRTPTGRQSQGCPEGSLRWQSPPLSPRSTADTCCRQPGSAGAGHRRCTTRQAGRLGGPASDTSGSGGARRPQGAGRLAAAGANTRTTKSPLPVRAAVRRGSHQLADFLCRATASPAHTPAAHSATAGARARGALAPHAMGPRQLKCRLAQIADGQQLPGAVGDGLRRRASCARRCAPGSADKRAAPTARPPTKMASAATTISTVRSPPRPEPGSVCLTIAATLSAATSCRDATMTRARR